MHLPQWLLIVWLSILTTVGGLAAGALWRAGRRFVDAVLAIAELPDVVRDLTKGFMHLSRQFAELIDRVDRLEKYLPESFKARATATDKRG